jgi:hypothetical protein
VCCRTAACGWVHQYPLYNNTLLLTSNRLNFLEWFPSPIFCWRLKPLLPPCLALPFGFGMSLWEDLGSLEVWCFSLLWPTGILIIRCRFWAFTVKVSWMQDHIRTKKTEQTRVITIPLPCKTLICSWSILICSMVHTKPTRSRAHRKSLRIFEFMWLFTDFEMSHDQ